MQRSKDKKKKKTFTKRTKKMMQLPLTFCPQVHTSLKETETRPHNSAGFFFIRIRGPG